MTDEHLIKSAERYCQEAGITEGTLGIRVFNNSRFFATRRRRVERAAEESRKLDDFINENPPGSGSRRDRAAPDESDAPVAEAEG